MQLAPFLDRADQVRRFLQTHRIGLATLVFSDLVGSTKLKQLLGDTTALSILQQHNQLLREVLAGFEEVEEIETAGDSFFLVFSKPSDAVRFGLRLQRRLRALSEKAGVTIADRIGIHVGEVFVEEREDLAKRKDLYGIQVDICARLAALGEGDQILMSRFAFENARQVLAGIDLGEDGPVAWLRHGLYELKGVAEPLEVCEVGKEACAVLKPPSDGEKAKRCAEDTLRQAGWRPAAGSPVPRTEWVVTEKLGEGGFGEVWKATHRSSGEVSAFKFSFRDDGRRWLEASWESQQALLRGGAPSGGIVQIHEAMLDAQPYALRMEWVEGRDLGRWCVANGGARQVPLQTRVGIVAQLAGALRQAHACGVVHRDIKPSNILVAGGVGDPSGVRVQLGDFGAGPETQGGDGELARTTALIGSPLYMSPEQANGEPVLTPATDIYALGAVLYELLTGRPPFVRGSVSAILDAHRHEDPQLPNLERPEVPDAIQRICLKAMEKRTRDRYATAGQMEEDLRRFLAGEPVRVRPSQYDNFIASRIRRHVEELSAWRRDRLLTDPEFARLAGAYARFDRSGLAAVMETRRVHAGVVFLLVGGWFILDGCSLWLATQWSVLRDSEKILIGWLPVLLTNGLWVLFWRRGSYRAAHIMMLLGAASLPFGVGVSLHSARWWAASVGDPSLTFGSLSNLQELAALLAGMAWTGFLGWRTQTVSISAIGTILTVASYALLLDVANIRDLWSDRPATLALRALPLVLPCLGVGFVFSRSRARRLQATPWFGAALVLFILSTLAIAWEAPGEWLRDPKTQRSLVSPDALAPLQGLCLAACAFLYFPLGILMRRRLLVAARPAYIPLLWVAPLCLFVGSAYSGSNWPESWPSPRVFSQAIPLPDLLSMGLSLGCILVAMAVQVRFYVFAGLAFLTFAEWRIGHRFFASENPSWAILLLALGMVLTAILTALEVRRWMGGGAHDMDDVLEHLRVDLHSRGRDRADEDGARD